MRQPSATELVRAIEALLPASIAPAAAAAPAASDLYEAYLFAELLTAAGRLGGVITYETVDGLNATQLLFRTSPGQIYSRRQQYTHAVIRFQGQSALEAHVGVRVDGQSGVLHECDVLAMRRTEARNCRALQIAPRSSSLVVAVEAKFYATPLDIDLGRSFVGLIGDISAKWPYLASNSTSGPIARLFAKKRDRHFYERAVPGSPASIRLRSFFEDAFARYAAG